MTKKSRIVKELGVASGEWIRELVANYSYLGSLKKRLSDALAKLNHLNFEQKQKAWELVVDSSYNLNQRRGVLPSLLNFVRIFIDLLQL